MNSLGKPEHIYAEGEFHSDKVYEFHPLAAEFDLMNSEELTELGRDIAEHGQKITIDLYEGKILDGRNRYLACKEFRIIPRFKYLPKEEDPKAYIFSMNLYRRHLTPAVKAEKALKWLVIETRRARLRKISKLKQFKGKITDPPSEGGTVPKGEAIKIVAMKGKISKNSILTAKKVQLLNDPEINDEWEDAKKGTSTIKNVNKLIREKYPSKRKKYINEDKSEKEQALENEIKDFTKGNHLSIAETFEEVGKRVSTSKSKEGLNHTCGSCGKANILSIKCNECGAITPKVICYDDLVKNVAKLRNPKMRICKHVE